MTAKTKKTASTGSQFETVASTINQALDSLNSGAKIDRKGLAKEVVTKTGATENAKDIKSLVGIICRFRKDIEVRKGKEGGSFKL